MKTGAPSGAGVFHCSKVHNSLRVADCAEAETARRKTVERRTIAAACWNGLTELPSQSWKENNKTFLEYQISFVIAVELLTITFIITTAFKYQISIIFEEIVWLFTIKLGRWFFLQPSFWNGLTIYIYFINNTTSEWKRSENSLPPKPENFVCKPRLIVFWKFSVDRQQDSFIDLRNVVIDSNVK